MHKPLVFYTKPTNIDGGDFGKIVNRLTSDEMIGDQTDDGYFGVGILEQRMKSEEKKFNSEWKLIFRNETLFLHGDRFRSFRTQTANRSTKRLLTTENSHRLNRMYNQFKV